MESTALAIVSKCTGDAITIFQQRDHGVFHENIQAQMDSMVLKGADHLQAGAIAYVREPRIAVPAEITLQDSAVCGSIEKRAPGFQLAHTPRRFLGMQFRHAPTVKILPAAHCV